LRDQLAIQQEEGIDVRERSAEKERQTSYDMKAFSSEIKDLKEQLRLAKGTLDERTRELNQIRKDAATTQAEY